MPTATATLDLAKLVAKCYKGKKYRPTAVALIFNEAGQVLLGLSTNRGTWGFPKGGIERGESAARAVLREVSEELGVPREHFRVERFLADEALDGPSSRLRAMGFAKGKHFMAFRVVYTGPAFKLKLSELSAHRWVAPDQVAGLLKGNRPARAAFYLRTLALA